MARIRADYVFGTTDAALTSSDATLSSPALTRLPAVASPDVAAITLHDSAAGTYEIVHVTAHTASATMATILRGQEGSTAQAWGSGSAWLHGVTSGEVDSLAFTAAQGRSDNLGANLTKLGLVLTKGAAGAFDAQMVESPSILRDPKSGRYVMTYTGYDATSRGRAGYAYSDDLKTWTKAGVLLANSGTAGAPDENGVTGPVLYWDNAAERYVLYYIGLTALGYEAGTKTICYATATSLAGPWTRQGSVIGPSGTGWRQKAVWHVSIVERSGTWYCFFNATGGDDKERIGYATAPALTGPWTVQDATSPVVDVGTGWESSFVGDPSVRRVGDLWVMDYYGYNGTSAADGIAVTSDHDFPLGWTRHSGNPILEPSETYDAKYAHKPFVFVDGGRVFHYYTAVAADDSRVIALAVSEAVGGGVAVQNESAAVALASTLDFQGAGVTATSGAGKVVVTIPGATGGGGTGQGLVDFARARRTSGNITINSTTFTNVDTGLDLVLSASAGDIIEASIGARIEKASSGLTYAVFDFHTIVDGAPVNSLSSESAAGTGLANSYAGWASGAVGTNAAAQSMAVTGSKRYTVQAGDISAGTVTLRLRAFTGAQCTLAAADPMLYVQATNLGPAL